MSIKVYKHTINTDYFQTDLLCFIPENALKHWGIFTHGYTSSKNSILAWATRLAESGMPCVIFDVPGHYLGSYNEVESFDDFENHAHTLFVDALEFLKSKLNTDTDSLVLGGHSLGALLSLRALDLPELAQYKKLALAVGFGLNHEHDTHLFDTEFYQKTLEVRNQLVSDALDKSTMFKWIKEQKSNLSISGHKIHLICGLDDLVVGTDGAQNLKNILEEYKNEVSLETPKKMPHHQPELAAAHINAYLRKNLFS